MDGAGGRAGTQSCEEMVPIHRVPGGQGCESGARQLAVLSPGAGLPSGQVGTGWMSSPPFTLAGGQVEPPWPFGIGALPPGQGWVVVVGAGLLPW